MKSVGYVSGRYFVPSSLLASQTTKTTTARHRRRALQQEPLTYSRLFDDQAKLVTLNQLNSQTAANRATALRLFMKANHLQLQDVVGTEMRPHYPLAVEKMVALLRQEGRSDRTISNTRSALTPWKHAVIADDTARALLQCQKTPFVVSVTEIMEGHPVKRVAKQTGIPSDMLYGWLAGKVPRVCNAKYVRRLEGFFGLKRESLVALTGIVDGVRPREHVGESPKIAYRQHLGSRSSDRYFIVPPADSPLRPQWLEYTRYKTVVVPTLLRSRQGRWTPAAVKVAVKTDANWYLFLDNTEIPSAKAAWTQVASYLGWLSLPPEQGGPGLAPDTLQTLAWLAVPDHIEAFLDWYMKRCGGKRSKSTATFLGRISSLVRPKVGFLCQKTELLKTLPERFHGKDWQELCQRQYEYVEELQNAYSTELEPSRDPFTPMQSVIDLPQPLEAIADMTQRMRRDRPNGTVMKEAIWARNLVMVKLFVSNPVRLRNMATLTWSKENINSRHPDNKPSLYQRVDGSWWIFIPRKMFKNRKRKDMREYDSPVHPSVWSDLERYLFRHRNDLVRWPTDLVFLARTRDPQRKESVNKVPYRKPPPTFHKPFMEMNKTMSILTKQYLWNCDGIGTHAFRHIVATSILKTNGGDIKTAALVLNDTEATVTQAYSGMRSGDGSVRMAELLGKTPTSPRN